MKIPQRPPVLDDALRGLTPEDLAQVLVAARTAAEQPYWHWDELRHRTPPEGLSTTQWWVGIKLGRLQSAREVPGLKSTDDAPFLYTLPDAVLEAVHAIDSQSRGNISLPDAGVNNDDRNRYLVSSLMEEAITSSQLEGAATTRKVAADMLRSGRAPVDQSERMILNNYRAMQHILTIVEDELSPEAVLELHRILTMGTLKNPAACGRLQQPGEERISVVDERDNTVLHRPPPAEQLPDRLRHMCDFANGRLNGPGFMHPALRAIVLHFWLAYDHPFEDGNGRTARALFYWAMLRQGYWLFEYLSISSLLRKAPGQYARSYLQTETDGNDLTYFILAQLRVIGLSLQELERYLKRKQRELREAETRLRDTDWMNHRQRALVAHALRHPAHRYTIASHQNSHRVAYATARADLLALSDSGLLVQKKQGKKMVFVPAASMVGEGDNPKSA